MIRKGSGIGHDFIYNGLDRIDSKAEYTIDNVVACCRRCNVAKNDMSAQEFMGWAQKVYEHFHANAMAAQWGATC